MFKILVLSLAGLLFGSCHTNEPSPSPESQLPPATQTGANTFGCLLNGQAFTPNGSDGSMGSNFIVTYDPTYNNGSLVIGAFRYTTPRDQSTFQRISMFTDNIHGVGVYPLTLLKHQEALFQDARKNCVFYPGDSHFRKGTLIITRLDAARGIISGTFDFTLYKPGCDSVVVTKGRFDKKL
ncbi:DUF6252 family protein [Hymenobacter pini]|uniref:DUF6252 family protein n=1 Tax=Hymenobacter pini TaxID=2880879 RepID=UPI001CF4DEF4|nr:DUF6252 family protein [Hymenobacter pini]MCA8832565.1 DUF6252 family protein [Hymenobacter pini]